MPKAGSGGNEQYVQNAAPLNPRCGDQWYDGARQQIFTPSGWADVKDPLATTGTNLSNAVSVLKQSVSALSAIAPSSGGIALDTQGLSSTAAAGIQISGLSATLLSSAIYRVESRIMYQMSAADAFGVAITFPAGTITTGTMRGFNAVGVSAPLTAHFNEAASGSIVYSAIVATTVSTLAVEIDATIQTSATAGAVAVFARVSATTKPANILRGSFIQVRRIDGNLN